MTDLLNILLPPGKISLKIGLYFGSFNPVHIGHMAIANFLVEYGDIDQLWFVVTPQNPLKKKENLLNDIDRLEMMHIAVGDDFRFRVSDIEFRLPKPSYTIDTLTYLAEKFPAHHFSIIMGSDNLVNFHRWKNYEVIAQNYGIIVYPHQRSTGNQPIQTGQRSSHGDFINLHPRCRKSREGCQALPASRSMGIC